MNNIYLNGALTPSTFYTKSQGRIQGGGQGGSAPTYASKRGIAPP